MVDLPLPVLPMMAVVWPRRRTKSRSWRVASSASAKRNQACWKAQTASPFRLGQAGAVGDLRPVGEDGRQSAPDRPWPGAGA